MAISTPDPSATINGINAALNGSAPALVQWDAVRGLSALNKSGEDALARMGEEAAMAYNPTTALVCAQRLPAEGILFVHNAPRLLDASDALNVIQGIWNLRDLFKGDGRTLVLIGAAFSLPPELAGDVLLLDEARPGPQQLEEIVREAHLNADLAEPGDEICQSAVAAMLGLASFAAEQACAMSLTKTGLDLEALRERKCSTINATRGLSVWGGQESFDDIAGLENVKTFLAQVIRGRNAPRVVVFIDEIDKAFAGMSGDTSGVAQDQGGTTLSWMQDTSATGIICIGPPGTSKSMLAKAVGNEAEILTIALDYGALKGSLMGESEQRLREAFKVLDAIAGERVLIIATCNSVASVPPEIRRRFNFGTFFFDLPTAQERAAIWALYCQKFALDLESARAIEDENWTGAEIRQCCDIAYRLDCPLAVAATYVVPVARSAADQIDALRSGASGRFLSASEPGIYRYQGARTAADGRDGRGLTLAHARLAVALFRGDEYDIFAERVRLHLESYDCQNDDGTPALDWTEGYDDDGWDARFGFHQAGCPYHAPDDVAQDEWEAICDSQ